MATRSVNIVVKARDDASRKFGTIGKSAGGMGSMLKKAAVAAAAYFGAREIKRFLQGSIELYGKQEKAVKGLSDALDLLGEGGRDTMKDMQDFASSIQKTTIYGDEAVLEIMAMGSAMGKLSGEDLKKATKAAIGLSKAYSIDLTAAMRLVARAAQGDTATLARYGIKLGEGLTSQEKFNKVLQIGARNFALAEGETNTYVGAIEQAKNAIGDLRESIGQAMVPVIIKFAKWIKTLNIDTLKTTLNFIKWTASISVAILLAPKIVAGITAIVKALKAMASGQAIVQALAGPVGWKSLAVGIAIAAGSVIAINHVFGDLNDNLETTQQEVTGVADSVGGLNTSIKNLGASLKAKTWKGIRAVAEPEPWKKVHDQIAALRRSVWDFGKTEAQLLIEQMKELGYSLQSIEMAESYLGRKEWLEGKQTATESVTEAIKQLKREIATFGKTEFEIKLFDLKQLGASKKQLQEVRALYAQLDVLRKGKEEKFGWKGGTFAAREIRYQAFVPGTTVNYEQQIALNTKNIIKAIGEMGRDMKILVKKTERSNRKIQPTVELVPSRLG